MSTPAIIFLAVIVGATVYFLFFGRDPIHDWKYRNPADRTCKKCGRNEQEEVWGDDFHMWGYACERDLGSLSAWKWFM
jgi:hypothetical protein